MPSFIKSLMTKTRKAPTAEEIEALQRANQTLQFRVMQIVRTTSKPATLAA